LHSAAGETIKTVHSRPGVRKYWWNSDVIDAKSAAIRTHNDWVTAGKPRQGDIFSMRNETRRQYRAHITRLKQESKNLISSNLQNALEAADRNKFWRIWGVNFKNKERVTLVNGITNSELIANYLADNFRIACLPNDPSKNTMFMSEYLATSEHDENVP